MPPHAEYGALLYFTKELYEALVRAGADARMLVAMRENPKPFLDALFKSMPEATLSFNGLLPDSEGRFFCDLIKTPHIALLTKSPTEFLALTKSERNLIGCIDSGDVRFFQGIGFKNVFLCPHAVSRDLKRGEEKKERDVAFFGTLVEHEAIEKKWEGKFSKEVASFLKSVVDQALKSTEKPLVDVFVEAVNAQGKGGVDPRSLNIIAVIDDLVEVISARARLELVSAIKDVTVDVFGSGPWKEKLEAHKNIRVHGPIPFDQSLEEIGKTKIILSSFPNQVEGLHERLLSAYALGSVPVSLETTYLKKNFAEGVYYRHGAWDQLNQEISRLVKDGVARDKISRSGSDVVMKHHTFDVRAKEILKSVSALLTNEAHV